MKLQNKIVVISILCMSLLPHAVFAVDKENIKITLMLNNKPKAYITNEDVNHFLLKTPFLSHTPKYQTEIEKTVLCIDKKQPCFLTSSIRKSFTTHVRMRANLSRTNIKTFVNDLAKSIDTEPKNARLKFNPNTNQFDEVTSHTDGIKLNKEQTTEAIIKALSDNQTKINLSYDKIPAQITSQTAHELGIKELIGQGISDFRGSTKSRIHNIKTASKHFDGLAIAPGEEFSFTSILGPVDGEHGYKEELVIKDNETKPEYGGGICQVSTTVFRGAVLTGLKITERHNHSYPVHYYLPIGFDATVYVPRPDLRFINNTPGYILLNVEMEGTKLIFNYYGTKDGRTVTMDGPHVTERQPNGAMKTYFTQTVKDASGTIVIDDVFKSNYKSPNDYPHPGAVTKLTSKPKDWSKKQWKEYKQQNGL